MEKREKEKKERETEQVGYRYSFEGHTLCVNIGGGRKLFLNFFLYIHKN